MCKNFKACTKYIRRYYVQEFIQWHEYILLTLSGILYTCTIYKIHTRHTHSGSVIELQLLTTILFLLTSQLQLDGNHTSIFNPTFTDHGVQLHLRIVHAPNSLKDTKTLECYPSCVTMNPELCERWL